MRRVSLEKAKSGMEIARPVLDVQGNMLLSTGIELREKHIEFLKSKGVYELLIEDRRVPDLTIKPLVKPEMQRGNLLKRFEGCLT